MLQDMWNAPPGFRPTKSAPSSPAKPLGVLRTRSESFHAIHKVPVGDTPYVKAKNVQLVDKDPEKAIPLFWAAINAGDRVDSALKDMAIVMKQQNRAEEAIEAIKSLRSRCSDQAQESLDNILLDLYKRCGRLDDQISLLRHKLYLIQQGLAFNGKRTKTARSQGKKFQVSVEQEATRLLGNLGWALMQQNNYIEAEDAYRRALTIAPDNNKMCNLGICLMKQGRIAEAKETLRLVKPAVADGPRGVDSHLKAYERAQQMLKDLESEMMNKGGDRVEQSRLFDAFLGSSSIWQPQPCRDPTVLPTTAANKAQDDFADENSDSNLILNQIIPPPQQRSVKQLFPYGNSWKSQPSKDQKVLPTATAVKIQDNFTDENIDLNTSVNQLVPPQQRSIKQLPPYGNPWNIDAQPFYSSRFLKEPMVKEPIGNQFQENLKRTRSGNAANSMRVNDIGEYTKSFAVEPEKPENKTRRLSSEDAEKKLTEFLPDNKDFEEAIIAAVLGSTNEAGKNDESSTNNAGIFQRKIDKRLKVFQDITLSLSPRA
ncbi:protein POLLENLESS 3-LIKE 2-like [Mangifera indica]|uniref:protein POLLENLESS 3-LIKE 2-like n=1 Tax=Mangifera indica TaxID=29780 RepID=UPI001CFA1891|nr:protein POLLENLESS 3-LIKE 2-like [Mangifera indica]